MKDIPGELFHQKFEDFSTSRNLVGIQRYLACRSKQLCRLQDHAASRRSARSTACM